VWLHSYSSRQRREALVAISPPAIWNGTIGVSVNRLITPLQPPPVTSGAVQRRERLGGMLNYYYRDAA
jgi:hypothetical protein